MEEHEYTGRPPIYAGRTDGLSGNDPVAVARVLRDQGVPRAEMVSRLESEFPDFDPERLIEAALGAS